MSKLNEDIDTMMDEIKQPKASVKYIYESPDKGKNCIQTRVWFRCP